MRDGLPEGCLTMRKRLRQNAIKLRQPCLYPSYPSGRRYIEIGCDPLAYRSGFQQQKTLLRMHSQAWGGRPGKPAGIGGAASGGN